MTTLDLTAASDASLVVAIGRWRQDALAEAYRRHSGAVFALARRVVGGAHDAEEVTQEVFVRLWNDADRFDPERGSLRSYLLVQAHGRAVDLVRSESRRKSRQDRDEARTVVADYDVEREVGDVVANEQVRAAVAQLDKGQRQAIELAYFGGYTYREVAAALGEPEGTVKSRIRGGMAQLRLLLDKTGVTV